MFILFSLFDIFFNYSLIRSCLVCTLFCLSMHVFNLKKLVSFKKKKSDLPLPPGPTGLPLLGYLPFLKREAHLSFTELSKTYGPIYQIKLGNTRVVVITSAKYVREAFRQQVFSGRPSNELTKILKGFGVVNSNGELWREQRSFIHSVLKEFGARSMMNGKVGLEKIINDEMQSLVKDIQQLEGKTFIRPKLARTVTNIVCSLLMGFRFKTEEDKHFKRLIELMDEGFRLLNVTMISNFFPFTRHLPYISHTFKKIKRNHAESGRYFKQITDEHRSTLDPFNIRDVCDAYIKEHDRIQADGRRSHYFSEEQLIQVMNDMFSAGIETVSNTLDWSVLFFVLYPEVQANIQEEIDRVIGSNRLPELDDLANMPYTEATMYEVMRRSSIVALGHVHSTLSDTELGGFRIPKNTHILSNLWGIHMDEKTWKNPEQFDPTRFLKDGKLNKSDNFMPFSVGRRMCLGDVLTKMEFFLFITNVLMNYTVECDEGDKPSLDVFCATIIFPKPFKLKFVQRRTRDTACLIN